MWCSRGHSLVWLSLSRMFARFTAAALGIVTIVRPGFGTTSEDGGSGLLNVDHAWSMPVSALVVSTYAGTFSSDASDGSTRLFTFTPSFTKGLGGGFEGSAAIPFDGLSSDLDGEAFDRRFDLRRRDIIGKVRWTSSLSTPRVRVGLEGIIGLPLAGIDDRRAGGTKDPDNAFDPGLVALFSTNLGWFDFPFRIHANAGQWWSRNDGAVYYRTLPVSLPFEIDEVDDNDVTFFGVGAEAGFRRFVLNVELYTEQLNGARAQMKGQENLWRLTPSVRTEVGQNVGLMAALSFDISKDDPSTTFDPGAVFPETHLRIGLTLGNVLTRNQYEDKKRGRRVASAWPLVTAAQLDSIAAARAVIAASEQPDPEIVSRAPEPDASAVVPAPAAQVSTMTAPRASVRQESESSIATLEARIERLEGELRLRDLEARIASLELVTGAAPTRSGMRPPAGPPESAPPPAAPTEVVPQANVSPAVPPPAAPPADAPPATPPPAAPPLEPEAADSSLPDVTSAASSSPIASSASTSPSQDAATEALRARVAAVESRELGQGAEPPALPSAAASVATKALDVVPRVGLSSPTSGGTTVVPVVLPMGSRSGSPVTVVTGGAGVTPATGGPATSTGATTPSPGPDAAWAEIDSLIATIAPDVPPARPATAADSASSVPPAAGAPARVEPARAPDVVPALPLAVGERQALPDVPLTGSPVASDSVRVALDAWAELLAVHDAVIGVEVRGGGGDPERALDATQERAATIRDYLVVAGVAPERVVALGMGIDEDAPLAEDRVRLTLERIR